MNSAGLVVADELRGVDVAAIDGMFVIDSPAPAGFHRLGNGIWINEIIGAVPASDDGAVAEEGIGVGDEGGFEGFSEQFGFEAAGVDIEIAGDLAAIFEDKGVNAFWAEVDIGDSGVGESDAAFYGDDFERFDEVGVEEMEGREGRDVGCAAGLSGEGFAF